MVQILDQKTGFERDDDNAPVPPILDILREFWRRFGDGQRASRWLEPYEGSATATRMPMS
jgi:hypothetical protein